MHRGEPKRHHFVPRAILKRFVDQDGWLHYYSKREAVGAVRRTRIDNAFVEGHLYSEHLDDGTKDADLEHQLGELEDKMEPILSKLVTAARAGVLPRLNPSERNVWDLFLMIQWKRVPDLRLTVTTDEWVKGYFRETREQLKLHFPDRCEEIDALGEGETERRMIQNARVGALKEPSPRVLLAMRTRGIALLRVRVPGKSFIIGSRPVVQMAFRDGLSLVDEATEMWLPVASDVAVGAGRSATPEMIYDLNDNRPIRQLNLAIANQSTAFASQSDKLTRSIASAR